MCHDVSTDRLLRIYSVGHATAWISHYLVCHEDSDIKLFADFLNL